MRTTRHSLKEPRARLRAERSLSAAAAVLAAGLLVTGCGGSPSDASLNRRTDQPPAVSRAIAYSRCMRSHGVPGFPDPTISRSGGRVGIGMGIPSSVATSPAFKTAADACAKFAPDDPGGSGGPAPVTAQQHREIVRFAACMRTHGVSGFPDPDATGTFHLFGVNTNAPAFTVAVGKCQVSGMPLNISSQRSSGTQ